MGHVFPLNLQWRHFGHSVHGPDGYLSPSQSLQKTHQRQKDS